MDFTSLIFLVLAVAIFWRLRGVLGRRTGSERPPVDPFPKRDEAPAESNDNVVTLPRSGQRAPVQSEGSDRIDEMAPTGTALNKALKMLVSADANFEPDYFLTGASAAYEMIVTAFAAGDRAELKPLLSPEVYAGFVAAIDERERRGEKVESTFVGIDRAEITEAALKSGIAQVTVRFVSKLISVTRSPDGTVVDGDPTKVAEVTDVWTFAREIRSRDPNWKLIATEADA
ncbi:Tim44/TimA family putative adaptor protein [Methylobrevis albus]|nr:Tim44/TimA family putative adaptor protein [Methylobrevis albus]